MPAISDANSLAHDHPSDRDRPRVIVLRTAGTNCDAEMVRAFHTAGANVDLVHVDRVLREPHTLDRYAIIAFPGGFAHGDDIAAGRVLSVQVRTRLYERLRHAIDERGACVLGVCNGFQVLVQAGLLPGPAASPNQPDADRYPETPAPPAVALAANDSDRFIDDWANLLPDPASPCVWTATLLDRPPAEPPLSLPFAHGEGRFVCPQPILDRLHANHQIPLRYAQNPNGSAGDVAGICDRSGRVFGLMPHPERFLTWRHHPQATRLRSTLNTETPGLAIFTAAVNHVRQARVEVG